MPSLAFNKKIQNIIINFKGRFFANNEIILYAPERCWYTKFLVRNVPARLTYWKPKDNISSFPNLNRFGLPSPTKPKAIIVVDTVFHHLREGNSFNEFIRVLKINFQLPLILVSTEDSFKIKRKDKELDPFDLILKANGAYTSIEWQNYKTWNLTPLDASEAKEQNLKNEDYYISCKNFKKIKPSFPLFVFHIGYLPWLPRLKLLYYKKFKPFFEKLKPFFEKRGLDKTSIKTFFISNLNHTDRLKAILLLKKFGDGALNSLSSKDENLLGEYPKYIKNEDPDYKENFEQVMRTMKENEVYEPRVSKAEYFRRLKKCQIVLSITGLGELCHRFTEAWIHGKLLVCQDMSNFVHILYPLKHQENLIYCHRSLNNFTLVFEDIENNYAKFKKIAILRTIGLSLLGVSSSKNCTPRIYLSGTKMY